jgi:hypothetical protein
LVSVINGLDGQLTQGLCVSQCVSGAALVSVIHCFRRTSSTQLVAPHSSTRPFFFAIGASHSRVHAAALTCARVVEERGRFRPRPRRARRASTGRRCKLMLCQAPHHHHLLGSRTFQRQERHRSSSREQSSCSSCWTVRSRRTNGSDCWKRRRETPRRCAARASSSSSCRGVLVFKAPRGAWRGAGSASTTSFSGSCTRTT